MLNIGLSEVFILAVIILLFLRPKDVPVITRKIGKIMGTFRNYRETIDREIKDLGKIDDLENDKEKKS